MSEAPGKLARVRVELMDGSHVDAELPEATTTLAALLAHLEAREAASQPDASKRRHFTTYEGVPPVERLGPSSASGKAAIELQINLKGRMQAALDVVGRQFATDEELAATTLQAAGATSRAPTKLRLSHTYHRPQLSAAEQSAAVDNLRRQLGVTKDAAVGMPGAGAGAGAGAGYQPSNPAAAAVALKMAAEQQRRLHGPANISVRAAPGPPPLPRNRGLRVIARPPPRTPAAATTSTASTPSADAGAGAGAGAGADDDEDSDFYEITSADVELLEQSIKMRGGKVTSPSGSDLFTVRVSMPPPAAGADAGADGPIRAPASLELVFRARETVERVYAAVDAVLRAGGGGAGGGGVSHWLPAPDAMTDAEATERYAEQRAAVRARVDAQRKAAEAEAAATTARVVELPDKKEEEEEEREEQEAAAAKAAAKAAAAEDALCCDEERAAAAAAAAAAALDTQVRSAAAGIPLTPNTRSLRGYARFYLFRTPPFARLDTGAATLLDAKFTRQTVLHLAWLQVPVGARAWDDIIDEDAKVPEK